MQRIPFNCEPKIFTRDTDKFTLFSVEKYHDIPHNIGEIMELYCCQEYDKIMILMPTLKQILEHNIRFMGNANSLEDFITNILFSYCLYANDIELLEKIMQQNNYCDLFHSKFIICDDAIFKFSNENIFKFILNSMVLHDDTIGSFLLGAIRFDKINFIEILAEFGHRMSSAYISNCIMTNKFSIVDYAIMNNYDVQSAFDMCDFHYVSSGSSRLGDLFFCGSNSVSKC